MVGPVSTHSLAQVPQPDAGAHTFCMPPCCCRCEPPVCRGDTQRCTAAALTAQTAEPSSSCRPHSNKQQHQHSNSLACCLTGSSFHQHKLAGATLAAQGQTDCHTSYTKCVCVSSTLTMLGLPSTPPWWRRTSSETQHPHAGLQCPTAFAQWQSCRRHLQGSPHQTPAACSADRTWGHHRCSSTGISRRASAA